MDHFPYLPEDRSDSSASTFCSRLSLTLHIFPFPALLRTSASNILATPSWTTLSRQSYFLMGTLRNKPFNPGACTISVPRQSPRHFSHSVLSHISSRFQLRKSHHPVPTRHLHLFSAQSQFLCLGFLGMRLFPLLRLLLTLHVLVLQS